MSCVDHSRSLNFLMVPKKMSSNKEVWETIGFTFEEVGDDELCKAILPVGWKFSSEIKFNGTTFTTFVDKKGRERGFFSDKTLPYENGNWSSKLWTRFKVSWEFTNPKDWTAPVEVLAMDCAKNTTVFTAGRCDEVESKEYNELERKAKEFLDTNYPDWENPLKYWD